MVKQVRRVVAAVLVLVSVLMVDTGSASAHVVYGQGYVYGSGSTCTWGRAELSHGSGGGYTKISVGGVWRVAGKCVPFSVQTAKAYLPNYARVRHELWKRNSNGSWSLCRSSGWKYNAYAIGGSQYWVQTFDNAINYGKTPPCGRGTYGVTGYMQVREGSTWKGGKISGGQHSF